MLKKLSSIIMMVMLAGAGVTCPVLSAENQAGFPQSRETVVGTVTDAAGQGVIGAFVVIKGTQKGASTDLDGKFSLDGVTPGTALAITCIGYKPQEVVWNGGPVALTLVEDKAMLDEVVVTALGISREKKALGYAVQDVKSEALTRGGEVSLTDALQGKVAGLHISSSATGAGGSTNVVIRGNSSLSDNNAPLYVVDGVPFDSKQSTDAHANLWGGTDRAGGAFDINPEDIQSVSVLKGPTAAALYGSRAGNGVILITTKKGGLNEQGRWGISYSGKVSFNPIAYYLDIQNRYGQGLDGKFMENDQAWGGLLGEGTTPAWYDKTKTTPYIDNGDAMKQFYNTGFTQSHNLTVAGGKKDNPFRLTIGYDDTKGVVPGNDINKTSIDLVDKLTVNKWLNFDVKANYIHTVGYNRPNLGFYSTSWNILQTPRNISMADLDKYWVDNEVNYKQQNWYVPNPNTQNPYWIIRQENNRDVKDRLFGIIAANIQFTDHLSLKLKQGIDYSSTEYKTWYPYNDASFVGRPSMAITRSGGRELNSEALLTYTNKWGNWDFGANIGGNIMNNKMEGLSGSGESAPIIGTSFVALGTKQKASNTVYEKQINSVYAFVNVAYKNWLFIDLTARNDWSSTLPPDNRSYFYPSASASFLLNGIFDAYGVSYNKDVLDLGKVRFSVAQVGKDTEPYQLIDSYGSEVDAFRNLYTVVAAARANSMLKPEIATSYEVGTEWHFFKNRLGFDITYYNTVTKNQVMAITQPQSTGYQTAYKNVGEISNQGVEIMVNGDFIRTKHTTFGATINFSKNVSRVNKLAEGVSMYSLGQLNGSASTFQVIAKEGEKLGLLYDYGYKTDDQGRIIVGANGLPLTSDSQKVLGCIQPDFTGSFGLNFDYRGFGVNALFNFRKGGSIFSVTEYELARKGTAGCTSNRADLIVEGVTESGQPNTVKVSAQNYWKNSNVERFVYDASYIKLQEVSLSYNFPRKLIQNEKGRGLDHLKFSIYGTNLFYFLKNTPGTTPDGSSATPTMFGSAIDMLPIPNSRTFGLSLNIGF